MLARELPLGKHECCLRLVELRLEGLDFRGPLTALCVRKLGPGLCKPAGGLVALGPSPRRIQREEQVAFFHLRTASDGQRVELPRQRRRDIHELALDVALHAVRRLASASCKRADNADNQQQSRAFHNLSLPFSVAAPSRKTVMISPKALPR